MQTVCRFFLSLPWCHPLKALCSATADTTKLQTVTDSTQTGSLMHYRAAGSGSDKIRVQCGWEHIRALWWNWAKSQAACCVYTVQMLRAQREEVKVLFSASLQRSLIHRAFTGHDQADRPNTVKPLKTHNPKSMFYKCENKSFQFVNEY